MELLPREQRLAVLLHLRDSHGRTALPFFPIAGVATLQEIAAAMGLDEHALADLWRDLPIPDDQIAERLGVPRRRVQLAKLRASASPAACGRSFRQTFPELFPRVPALRSTPSRQIS